MKRLLIACSTVAFGLALGFMPLHAQQTYDFGFGGGVSLPIGSTSDALTAGPQGALSFSWIPAGSRGLGLQLDGMYQYLVGDEDELGGFDINQQVLNAALSVLYRFPTGAESRIRPYILGGGGVYNFDVKGDDVGNVDSQTEFGLEGGVGTDIEITPRFAIFVEGRYHNVFTEGDNFQLLPVSVGGRIGIGTR
jgi:opacity protein-like surface antigen